MNLRDFVDVKSRREALGKELNIGLENVGLSMSDEVIASQKNCENMIGSVQIPLGVAGPLKVKSLKSKVESEMFIPLATTEGALVASVNRGCAAISRTEGINVYSENAGMTRAPVFEISGIEQGRDVIRWVDENYKKIQEIAESTSSHLVLKKITPYMTGRNLWLRFVFDTGEAMGMNMATIAASQAVSFIEKEKGVKCRAISGNMCADKKPNYMNFLEGRGYKVWAEAEVAENVLNEVLKTNSQDFYETSKRKLLYGSIMSGSIGANAHQANMLTAIFLATGQDAAHVAECSYGVTTVEKIENGIYISIYLPDLPVGTVGGGTNLPSQKEALSIMGIGDRFAGESAQAFAEKIGAGVLAGELSLLASLAEGSLARAHEKYGRGK